MKSWRCKSRILPPLYDGETQSICERECTAQTPLKPKGCLMFAIYQEWEEIADEKEEGYIPPNRTYLR
jgi:hypothetical protein